ncbi:transforming acidic coiled-coil-containing protein 3-like [Vespa velutina]|uniref:transforming acidic coiled-coil-containing protein 3-like n=1 Tax=Vespa velutina TaxID=202808 RepID=UPI001FB37DC0|nr:transforming acidic coiled-coil-containing protein 3-like [Vespa velutina]
MEIRRSGEMLSPKSVVVGGQVREGTRVVLREITAMLHNSPPSQTSSRRKSGNDTTSSTFSKAAAEHEVKVRFAREFADADLVTYSTPESFSSESSYYSIGSTQSIKNSGISSDTDDLNNSQPFKVADSSYVDSNIPGVNELIRGCADIRIDSNVEEVTLSNSIYESPDNTLIQTFNSAIDDTNVILDNKSPVKYNLNETSALENGLATPLDVTHSLINSSQTQEELQEHFTCDNIPQESLNLKVNVSTDEGIASNEQRSEQDLKESEVESVKLTLETSTPRSVSPVDYNEAKSDRKEDIYSDTNVKETDTCNVDEKEADVDNIGKTDTNNTCTIQAIADIVSENINTSNTDENKPDINNLNNNVADINNINKNKTDIKNNINEYNIDTTINTDEHKIDRRININEHKVDTTININEHKTDPTINIDEYIKTDTTFNINENKTDTNNIDEHKIDTTFYVDENKADKNNLDKNRIDTNNIDGNKINKEDIVEKKTDEDNIDNKKQSTSNIGTDEVLDETLTLSDDIYLNLDSLNEVEQYEEFKPQRQSTTLSNDDTTCSLKKLELVAGEVADDIFISPLELEDDVFINPVLEIFQDPTSFDFLSARGNSESATRLRNESLYIKFDPLLANVSMLPQGNSQVFSTSPSGTIHKLEEIQNKNDEPIQVTKSDTKEVDDIDGTEKLELLRASVLQLEKELEKQKKEYESKVEKQKTASQEKITKLQAQLNQEIENKNQLTVVVDEYEKSISRLLTEKERDRANFEQEKSKVQEELQATNLHLSNTEAAFNDVHLKYERLKGVVSAYKNNEGVLKESIQENLETIKSLENRYDQLKTHAMSQLRKANLELVDIRKQHEAETVKLHAMVRKAELKSNSLAEIVEQKTKENKELTQILDELIARVGRQNAE